MNKADLYRIVRVKTDNSYAVKFDEKQKLSGRGIYCVKDVEILRKQLNKSKISRALKLGREVSDSEIQELSSFLKLEI